MIDNNARFDKEDLLNIFGNANCQFTDDFDFIEGISIDSRKINGNNAFIALKGENLDSHTKISDAYDAGVKLAITETNFFNNNQNIFENKNYILVDNTLSALGELGNYHRIRFSYPIVAVAGSNGKTTTKEIIAHILSSKYNVLKTFENFNNQLGVPLMLLAMNENYSAAVFEIGTNEPGEISILSNMVEPDYGIITNIGKEHLEKLIDLDGVELEETFLFGYLNKHNKTSIINFEDSRLVRYHKVIEKFFSYGKSQANMEYSFILNENLNPILEIKYENQVRKIKLNTIGTTTALNAAAASAVALAMGMQLNDIAEALEKFIPIEYHNYGRMYLEKIQNLNIINDCYNANPSSMAAALDTLILFKSNRKFAVLGDMRELGEASNEEHIEILKYSIDKADEILIFGQEFEKAFSSFRDDSIKYFTDKKAIADYLFQRASIGDAILVKGSRGTKMEDVLIELKKIYG